MSVSASDVMKLRQKTGAGMMECKKFLVNANGDMEKAILEMRKAGQTKADKKADRVAAEGIVIITNSSNNEKALLLEVNNETDFAARSDDFLNFVKKIAQIALDNNLYTVDDLLNAKFTNETTVEEARRALIAKIGENVQVRRLLLLESNEGVVGHYLHNGGRIGVLVALNTDNLSLAKDLAMHIAANKPKVIHREDVSKEMVDMEREVFMAQAKNSGKPAEIIEKMVAGRLEKFIDEISLLGQAFVKDTDKKVSDILKANNSNVLSFMRFEVGEGIEKKADDFVKEVMAQVRTED